LGNKKNAEVVFYQNERESPLSEPSENHYQTAKIQTLPHHSLDTGVGPCPQPQTPQKHPLWGINSGKVKNPASGGRPQKKKRPCLWGESLSKSDAKPCSGNHREPKFLLQNDVEKKKSSEMLCRRKVPR